MLVVEHIGQENKHYHAYVQYDKPKRLSLAKLHGAHVEKAYGSAQQNIDYCKCEDAKHKEKGITYILIDEEGEPKLKGGNYTVGYLKDLDNPEEVPANLYNVYRNIKKDFKIVKAKDFRKSVKVYWIQGPSGAGKTNKAMEIATEFEDVLDCGTDFIKYCNGFYLGTTKTARIAIYDDFRDSHMKPSEFINLIDYNKHWMNIKGDSILNNYNIIIITSVQKLERLYGNVPDEPRRQWERRVKIIDMFEPDPVCLGGLPLGYATDFNDFSYVRHDNSDNTNVIIDKM